MTPFYNGKNASYKGAACTEGWFGTSGLGHSSYPSVGEVSFGLEVGSPENGKIVKYGHCGRVAVRAVAERSVDPPPFQPFWRILIFLPNSLTFDSHIAK